MSAHTTTNDSAANQNQGFLLLAFATLLLIVVVPGLLFAGSFTTNHTARNILFAIAFVAIVAGLGLSACCLRLLSRKPAPVKATTSFRT